jgi:hypothetical protein
MVPRPAGFVFPEAREEKEQVVQFLHVRLPSVPIKVIRANAFDAECRVLVLRDTSGMEGACVFKDHGDVEFREVKYFCAFIPGRGVGSRLMKFVKKDAVEHGLSFVVLYGSHTATGFFDKQRFLPLPQVRGISRTIVMPRVEAYQRSTLVANDLVEEFKIPMDANTFHVGMKIKVRCGLRRVSEEDAVVKEIKDERIRVHFNKWTDEFDEWLLPNSKRLVLPSSARKFSDNVSNKKIRIQAPY